MTARRASATALLVALSIVRCGRAHGLAELVLQMARQALLGASAGWRCLAMLSTWAWGRWLLDLLERCCCAGLSRHHCQRKAWIQQRLQQAPASLQWLWLGSGFDAAGLVALARQPQLQLIEIDQPDSLALRQRLPLWRAQLPRPQTMAMRLPQQSGDLLALCAQAPSLLVAEGVLMYLPGRSLLRLLRAAIRLDSPPRLLFSALDASNDAGAGFHRKSAIRERWLAKRSETFLWRLPAARRDLLLQRCGYRVVAAWAGSGYGEYVIEAVHERAVPLDPAKRPCSHPSDGREGEPREETERSPSERLRLHT